MSSLRVQYGADFLEWPPGIAIRSVYEPAEIESAADADEEIQRALREPIEAPRLDELVGERERVAIIMPDPTRGAPKARMMEALREAMPRARDENVRIVVAYGKHERKDDSRLGLPPGWADRFRIVHHDAEDAAMHLRLTAADGTGFDVQREVSEADVVIGISAVRPHYFAGFTGGAKSVIPGAASLASIRANHGLRTDPRSRLGILRGNAARADQEALAGLLQRFVILNVVSDARGRVLRAAYGHPVAAHRDLIPLARRLGQVPVEGAPIVVAGASHPTSMNIYQITKVVAPAAKACLPGGCVIICGPCEEGTGGEEAVNEIIYRHTLTQYLPPGATCFLVSSLPRETVERTFFRAATTLADALDKAQAIAGRDADVAVFPDAGPMIPVTPDDTPESW